jgi:type IV secretion system protein VirB11
MVEKHGGANQSQQLRLEKLSRECGELILDALKDPTVTEVMLNSDGKLWLDLAGQGMKDTGEVMSVSAAESILATSATILNTVINYDNAILEGEFPLDGSRIIGLISPIVKRPVFSLRKKATRIFSLEDYKEKGIIKAFGDAGIITPKKKIESVATEFAHPIDAIRHAVISKKNILIIGGTRSGKSTLVNAVLNEIALLCPNDRVIAIEDVLELQLSVLNAALLKATKIYTMQQLLRATMRLRPDRIIIGEVRGEEAYQLLKAWNSGHPGGVCTMHANSSREGLDKFAQYIFEAKEAQNFSAEMISRMIASTVNFVIFIEESDDVAGREVSEMFEVKGYEAGKYILNPIQGNSKNETKNKNVIHFVHSIPSCLNS